MSDPLPWKRDDADPAVAEAARLLERVRPVRDWSPEREAALHKRLATLSAGREAEGSPWAWAVGTAAAAALVAAFVLLGRPGAPLPSPGGEVGALTWKQVDLGELGSLEVSAGTSFRQGAGPAGSDETKQVFLDHGSLLARIHKQDPAHPFVVVTPHLRVVVVGTRFKVEVDSASTYVAVQQGRVRVQGRGGGEVLVGAGEWVRSDDLRLAQAAPRVPAPTPAPESPPARPTAPEAPHHCARSLPVTGRRACLEQLARGEGLAAQNALFELSRLELDEHRPEQALVRLREFQHRFPASMLAPDASLTLITGLLAQGQATEALGETESFLSRYGHDTRAAQVTLIRANLLREQMNQPAEALALYLQVLAMPAQPELRDEALYFAGVCQLALGQRAEAQHTWEQYREQFPQGAHATEVSKAMP